MFISFLLQLLIQYYWIFKEELPSSGKQPELQGNHPPPSNTEV